MASYRKQTDTYVEAVRRSYNPIQEALNAGGVIELHEISIMSDGTFDPGFSIIAPDICPKCGCTEEGCTNLSIGNGTYKVNCDCCGLPKWEPVNDWYHRREFRSIRYPDIFIYSQIPFTSWAVHNGPTYRGHIASFPKTPAGMRKAFDLGNAIVEARFQSEYGSPVEYKQVWCDVCEQMYSHTPVATYCPSCTNLLRCLTCGKQMFILPPRGKCPDA